MYGDAEDDANKSTEFVFGLAGPVGTDFKKVEDALRDALKLVEYTTEVIRLSDFLASYDLTLEGRTVELKQKPEEERIRTHMDGGNILREKVKENAALAILTVRRISQKRVQDNRVDPTTLRTKRHAYMLHSLKRPEEVQQFRAVYDGGFFLIAVVAPKSDRIRSLRNRIADTHDTAHTDDFEDEARKLVERDEDEGLTFGQKLRDTFPTADLFVSLGDGSDHAIAAMAAQIERFVKLIMGNVELTPTREETAMFHAYGAAMRSGSLARQVGAAVTRRNGDVLAVGCNDVARAGGGIYWENPHYDHRDLKKKRDSSEVHEEEMMEQLRTELAARRWCTDVPALPEFMDGLSKTRMMNLLEFSRALHAEMDAILAAGRNGASVIEAELYTTTFPCHECAKLIVGSGLRRVVYIEPFPKSRVAEMFRHEIATEPFKASCNSCGQLYLDPPKQCRTCDGVDILKYHEDGRCVECGERHLIPFEPFVGVGPRRYLELFSLTTLQGSKLRRKDDSGNRLPWTVLHRRPLLPLSYLERELLLINKYRDAFARIEKKEAQDEQQFEREGL